MIRIMIACDNDSILLSKLDNNTQIELIKVATNTNEIIKNCKNTSSDMLILESKRNKKIIEKIYELNLNNYLIISATNLRTYLCFNNMNILLDLIKTFEGIEDTSILEKNIFEMLWKLHFNIYSKGTNYLKDAIIFAYFNNSLLYDTTKLIQEVAKIHKLDEKNIRNNIDNALNLAFNDDNLQYDIQFFDGYYDGRKVSLKYFISLAVHYINILAYDSLPK